MFTKLTFLTISMYLYTYTIFCYNPSKKFYLDSVRNRVALHTLLLHQSFSVHYNIITMFFTHFILLSFNNL